MFEQRSIIVCWLILCFYSLYTSSEESLPLPQILEGRGNNYTTCSNVSLTCLIPPQINPEDLIVHWLVNNETTTFDNTRILEESGKECKSSPSSLCFVLSIKCVNKTDSANYSCHARSSDDKIYASNSFALNVQEPIRLVNSSGDLRIKPDTSTVAEFWCEFSGPGEYQVTWSRREGNDLLSLRPSDYSQKKLDNGNVNSTLTWRDFQYKKVAFFCSVENGPKKENILYVLSAPSITLKKVIPTGAKTVFMNWTIDDGNSNITEYWVQMKKVVGTDPGSWTYYGEQINGEKNSCIIKNLEPNTTYQFKIQVRSLLGSGEDASVNVTTFDNDNKFTPDVTIKGTGPHSINIGWVIPQNEMKKDVHFYKVLMKNKFDKNEETAVYSDFSYVFTNLDSATNYSFQVMACNKYTNECGDWSKLVVGTTMDGEAGPPENVMLNCTYDIESMQGKVFVNWTQPTNPNGEIDRYNIVLQGAAKYINENGTSDSYTYGPKQKHVKTDQKSTQFENLNPNTNYTVSVSAVTRSRGSGIPAARDCFMSPAPPSDLAFQWSKMEEKGQWYFKLNMGNINQRNGVICCVRVFVVKLKPQQRIEELGDPRSIPVYSYQYVHNILEGGHAAYIADITDNKTLVQKHIVLGDQKFTGNYSNATCSKCPYTPPKLSIVPEPTAIPAKQDTSTQSINLTEDSNYLNEKFVAEDAGAEAKSATPYDGTLDRNSNYTGFVLVTVHGDGQFIPGYSPYFSILQPGPDLSEESDDAAAILLQNISFQILCGMIVISIMMLAAFCLLQHYTKQVAEAQGVEMTLRNSFRRWCRSLRGSHMPVLSSPPEVLPISKTALLAAFAELAKDSDYGFEQEFEMLPDRFTDRTTKASEARENTCKNRYPDIKAYDQTRVKLSQIDGIIGSDYINANFVISYKERKKFICAQGPMENTVCDFWRMIWEQHLQIVLMLTNLEEYNKMKCAKYWPDKEEEKKTYADITIHYVSEKRYSDYVVRELKMVREVAGQTREPEERSIFQYHFLMWKDFQAPEHPSGILKFIWRVNEAYSLEKGPILVHCSAGVGRTGTLVAIDSLLQQLDSEGQVLIFNTICDLRHQRNFLVQSLKQYIFVYRALVEYAQFGNTEIKAKNLKPTVEKMKQSDNGKLKSRLEEEFEKLTFTVNSHEHKSSAVGTAPENATKNRSTSIIPFDRNRVILTPIPGREHSTYINASFIEGYDNSESFIITQDPILDVTVADFWRMISEQNISTIVMLSSTSSSDGQKKTGRYWPDDETVHGNISVKHLQSESCPYYTRREFYIANVKTDDNLVVTQYQYNGWPTVEGEVPEVTRGLIELMDHATQHAVNAGPGPIVIHCELGSDRSSMFVALSILAQQLKTERRVDVVNVARKLRSQRQGMLTAFAQYEFLYRAILNYVDLHHLSDSESD
ncbi:tyrosine-protein phosphatase 69D isoform X3 [Planococcus citri]|uniref:tyrosine-protein phosphatase 69D isoform X3 n=1 Tax=Planococcus citri TaxID=170843 RepID=UPI0031F8DE1C